ncbi:MAG: hypothetical protein IKW58_01565 [Alphaproteobacteria bacterium]|nr:hypothetical protein [Alphaproteobacteria bacterium]
MIYKWAMIVGAILGLCSCQWENITDKRYVYQIQGIEAYKGQSLSSLFNNNGAPNVVKNLDDGGVIWIYYTNYRPVGGGEIISYNMDTYQPSSTNCVVKIVIYNEIVEEVNSNCN